MRYLLLAAVFLLAKGEGYVSTLMGLFAALLGVLVTIILHYYLPFFWYLANETALSEQEFFVQHRSKVWVTRVAQVTLLVSASLTILFIFSCEWKHKPLEIRLVCLSLLFPIFVAGGSLPLAFLEIVAGICLFVPMGHGPPGRERYIVSPRVRWVGLYRIVVTIVLFSVLWLLTHPTEASE